MDKAGKAVALEAYKKVFADAGVIVVTQYSGLTVRELTDLRSKLKSEGAALKVIKNRLAKIALDGKGGDKAGAMFVRGPGSSGSPPVFETRARPIEDLRAEVRALATGGQSGKGN